MAQKDSAGKAAENSAENSGKPKRGNPDRIKEYQFPKGVSGNPGGRPKKTWLTEVFEEMLEEKLSDPKAREAFKDAFWKKLLSRTVVSAMTLEKILERTEGKVSQPVQVSGDLTVNLAEEMRKAGERVDRMRAEESEGQ